MNELSIDIVYFAQLKEQRGCAEERIRTRAVNPAELYDQLQFQHGFNLDRQHLLVAINDAFSHWQNPLQDGDRVVFIPPVAGG